MLIGIDIRKRFMAHYHPEKDHQGLGNRLIEPYIRGTGTIRRRQPLGGMLKYYYRRET